MAGKRGSDLPHRERGAVLALVAVMIMVVLGSAALAVDLAALDRRGQQLQSVADAASLGAVATWVSTGDASAAAETTRELIIANGFGGEVAYAIQTPSANELMVTVTDESPQLFLTSIIGAGGTIERAATAYLAECVSPCGLHVDVPAPGTSITPSQPIDGFAPILVGAKVYSISRSGNQIACLDRVLAQDCPGYPRWAFPMGDTYTDRLPHTAVVGTQIWFLAQHSHGLYLRCWQTITETPCVDEHLIAPEPSAFSLGHEYVSRGGGLAHLGDRLFVYADNHTVHCFDLSWKAPCSEYGPDGLPAANVDLDAADPTMGTSGSGIDRLVDEANARIYFAIPIVDNELTALEGTPGVTVRCWDAITHGPCGSGLELDIAFGASPTDGRLFFHRSVDGNPTAVCVVLIEVIRCADLDLDATAYAATVAESATRPLHDALAIHLPTSENSHVGITHWNQHTNRLYVPGSTGSSYAACFDFVDSDLCGFERLVADGVAVRPFGFASDGTCVLAFGRGPLASFTRDLQSTCLDIAFSQRLYPCTCDGTPAFPTPRFEVDPEQIAKFDVTVYAADGNVLVARESILEKANKSVDLSAVTTTDSFVTLDVQIRAVGEQAFLDGYLPGFRADFSNLPVLVD